MSASNDAVVVARKAAIVSVIRDRFRNAGPRPAIAAVAVWSDAIFQCRHKKIPLTMEAFLAVMAELEAEGFCRTIDGPNLNLPGLESKLITTPA